MKSVTYWYQFFTARVKFTKCEICDSTKLTSAQVSYNIRITIITTVSSHNISHTNYSFSEITDTGRGVCNDDLSSIT